MPLILSGNVASATAGAYEVANSCRFNDGDSPELNKTPGSNGSFTTSTFSCWLKRSAGFGTEQGIFTSVDDSTHFFQVVILGTNTLQVRERSGDHRFNYITTRLLRDPGAWMNIVAIIDTTESTAGDRVQIWINGVRETAFSTSDAPDEDESLDEMNNTANEIRVGRSEASLYLDGYLAEVCWIDGTAYPATSFGEFDEDSPTIWKPKDVSGLIFGTNGFYCDFEDSANLGNDANGGTDLTEVNLDATDQATDTPTNNFCTMNPLDNYIAGSTFSEGNCVVTSQSSNYQYNTGTFGLTAGKWYYEMKMTENAQADIVGIAGRVCGGTEHYLGYYNDGWGYHSYDGKSKNNDTGTTYGDSWVTNDTVVGVFIDLDNNKLYFAKDGTIQNSGTGISITAPASVNDGVYYPAVGDNWNAETGTYHMNFGNPTWSLSSAVADANGYGSFEYDPSDGGSSSFDSAAKDFLAICTKNLGSDGG